MKRLKWILLFTSCVILSTQPMVAIGENEGQAITELEQITVSAKKDDQSIKDVVAQEEIQTQVVSGSVLDALGNQAGIQLRRNTLSGSEGSKLRFRGFDETRLRITKNGVPINRDGSYANGPVDWSILSSEDVEQIEIYRGAGPAKYGNTLGGVVNIVTKNLRKILKPLPKHPTAV